MYNKRLILGAVYIFGIMLYFLQGCNSMKSAVSSENPIEGKYNVGYFYPQKNQSTIFGSLLLKNGKFSFHQQNGIDIPEHQIERHSFLKYKEGYYKVNYKYSYQPFRNFRNVEDLEIIAEIYFIESKSDMVGNDSLWKTYLIRYLSKSDSLIFDSPFNELILWSISKAIE